MTAPRILKDLVDYACEHFALEEALMAEGLLSGVWLRHKAEHDKLTREVAKLMQDLESGKTVLSMKLLQFLRSWLQDHIAGVRQEIHVVPVAPELVPGTLCPRRALRKL